MVFVPSALLEPERHSPQPPDSYRLEGVFPASMLFIRNSSMSRWEHHMHVGSAELLWT